jgi:hypothetical protein
MLGFIHITKTGGTNIKDKNKNEEIIYGSYHNENASYYKNKKIKCFAIIRDPIERYISLFYYNTNGSNKYKKKDNTFKNINNFVDTHYKDRNFIKKYENGIQFQKQVEWLKEADLSNTFIVKFDKKNLINNIRELCNFNNINFIYNDNIKNINTTNYNNNIELTEDSKNKIIEMYIEDNNLYSKLLSLNKSFCKLEELYN